MGKKFQNNGVAVAQAGFIKIVIIVVAALVVAKYVYDIDVVGFLTQGKPKEILDKVYELGSAGWEKYSALIIGVWNYIIELAKNLLGKLR